MRFEMISIIKLFSEVMISVLSIIIGLLTRIIHRFSCFRSINQVNTKKNQINYKK